MMWSDRIRPYSAALAAVTLLVATPLQAAELTLEEHSEIEVLLSRLGFTPGPVDGVIDEDTRAAIARYKDFAALVGDSEPNRALLEELRAVTAAVTSVRQEQGEEPEAVPEAAVAAPTPAPEPPAEAPSPAGVQEVSEPALPAAEADSPTADEELEPVSANPVDLALRPHRAALASGQTTKAQLAKEFNNKGRDLFTQGRYEEAIAQYNVAIALDPEFAAAYHNRGVAHEVAGRRDRATPDFEKAFSLGFGRLKTNSP